MEKKMHNLSIFDGLTQYDIPEYGSYRAEYRGNWVWHIYKKIEDSYIHQWTTITNRKNLAKKIIELELNNFQSLRRWY
jgi:hypothetical protein